MYRHRLSQLRHAKLARIVITSALACVIAVPVAAGTAPASAAVPSAVVDSGHDWTVTQAAGGFAVSVRLPGPLPAVNDSPELVADGTVLGPADESADGLTLSLTTMDPSVATAKEITWQW